MIKTSIIVLFPNIISGLKFSSTFLDQAYFPDQFNILICVSGIPFIVYVISLFFKITKSVSAVFCRTK